MAQLGLEGIILAIILATLAAIVYSLRVMVMLERRIARIDLNVERVAEKVLVEEARIESALNIKPVDEKKSSKKKSSKKSKKKSSTKKKSSKKKSSKK